MRSRVVVGFLGTALLCACGGARSAPAIAPAVSAPVPASDARGVARFTLIVPARVPAARNGRRPQFVPASAAVLDVSATNGSLTIPTNGIDVSGTSPKCSPNTGTNYAGRACTLSVPVPAGAAVTLSLQVRDSGATVLAKGSAGPVAVTADSATTLPPITLGGLVTKYLVAMASQPAAKVTGATGAVVVTLYDADGDIVVAPGTPIDAAGAAFALTITSDRPGSVLLQRNGGTAASSVTVSAPSDSIVAVQQASYALGTHLTVATSNTGATRTGRDPYVNPSGYTSANTASIGSIGSGIEFVTVDPFNAAAAYFTYQSSGSTSMGYAIAGPALSASCVYSSNSGSSFNDTIVTQSYVVVADLSAGSTQSTVLKGQLGGGSCPPGAVTPSGNVGVWTGVADVSTYNDGYYIAGIGTSPAAAYVWRVNNPAGGISVTNTDLPSSTSEIWSMIKGSDGNLWFLYKDTSGYHIATMPTTLAAGSLQQWPVSAYALRGLVEHPNDGNFYAVDYQTPVRLIAISRANPAQQTATSITTATNSWAGYNREMTVGGDGDLYIAYAGTSGDPGGLMHVALSSGTPTAAGILTSASTSGYVHPVTLSNGSIFYVNRVDGTLSNWPT